MKARIITVVIAAMPLLSLPQQEVVVLMANDKQHDYIKNLLTMADNIARTPCNEQNIGWMMSFIEQGFRDIAAELSEARNSREPVR